MYELFLWRNDLSRAVFVLKDFSAATLPQVAKSLPPDLSELAAQVQNVLERSRDGGEYTQADLALLERVIEVCQEIHAKFPPRERANYSGWSAFIAGLQGACDCLRKVLV